MALLAGIVVIGIVTRLLAAAILGARVGKIFEIQNRRCAAPEPFWRSTQRAGHIRIGI
jgi:hypothetical protein